MSFRVHFWGDVLEMGAFRYRIILFVMNMSVVEYLWSSLHRKEEEKISKCNWHYCFSHHVRYFQRNDWSKPAINSISLDSHESKVTCVFLQSYFTCIVCISRDHLSWFAQLHGVYVYIYMCVLWHMINVGLAAACPSSSVLLVASLFTFFLHLFFPFHSYLKEKSQMRSLSLCCFWTVMRFNGEQMESLLK